VADFRDPWVAGDPSQTRRNVPVWEARAEASVMREATAIVVNTPGAGDFLRETYPQYATKITSITNGYDPDRFDANPIPPFSGSTIEIVHTGEIYANRSPVPFLDAVQLLDAAALGGRALRVRFIGGFQFEKQKKETEERIRRGLHGSVFLEGQVPYSQSIQAMVQADLLLLLDTPGRRAGVPAKLFEYIGAGRPVLALAEPEGDVAWVLKVSGIPHRIASPVDRGAIRLALVDLLNDPATRRCCNQDKLLPPRFTRERLAGDLAALLDSCLGTSSVMVVDGSLPEVVTR
jgi:glycosyltransferase involved in cell wall biosynthesis